MGGAEQPLPARQQQQLGFGRQHPRREQVGEVLQGGEGQSSPSQPGSSSKCDVEDSVLDVNKWVRCCKVGRGRAAPPARQQQQVACGRQHPRSEQVGGRCCKVGRGRTAPPRHAAAASVMWGTAS